MAQFAQATEAEGDDSQKPERLAYKINEVAEMLGINHWTVRRAIENGEIASFRVGTRRLIRSGEIQRLIGGNVPAGT